MPGAASGFLSCPDLFLSLTFLLLSYKGLHDGNTHGKISIGATFGKVT